MSQPVVFPKLSDAQYERILTPPSTSTKPIRVVVDTDFNNEVDDYFALAWMLLQSTQGFSNLNMVQLEACLIEPFSFKTRLDALVGAYKIYLKPISKRKPKERKTLAAYEAQIEGILALGLTPFQLELDPHLTGKGDLGVSDSWQSLCDFYKLFDVSPAGKVFPGSTRFMKGLYDPVDSSAVRYLIKLALSASPKEPLYVVAIACVTNIASAILLEPKIIKNMVVIWDSGYPTHMSTTVNNSLNLDEDLYASQLLFSCGVPLVYVPGFYISQQLNMSLPDVTTWFRPSGPVGEALYQRYTHNPLFSFYGIDPTHLFGRNWVIWDLSCVAWVLNPGSVSSEMVRAPTISNDKLWKPNPKGHLMREATGISINSIFPTFARQLRIWSS